MNTSHDDTTSGTADQAAGADRGEHSPPPEAGGQPDMREVRGEAELQGMREDGDRYEQMREPGSHVDEAGVPGDRDEQLAPLFQPPVAEKFKLQWDEVQIGFVDDPAQAVRRADELVAQVMNALAGTFAGERANVERELDRGDTELMRVALQRYRSFFERLLSL